MDDLLKTKVKIPKLNLDTVVRKRLFELLDEGLNIKFTLVSAPAGYGKTTLICDWAAYTR